MKSYFVSASNEWLMMGREGGWGDDEEGEKVEWEGKWKVTVEEEGRVKVMCLR